jgi:hypothetical protein
MTRITRLFAIVILAVGCGRYHGIDTGNLASSFKTAEPTLKVEADTAIKAIREGKLTDALTELQKLGKRAKLSAEQQQAVKDLIQQVQTKMEADAKKAAQKKP